jgi:MoaA/NifB/PqqE/SkfB family radical SAM enzyme
VIVDVNGDVRPCCFYYKPLGNLYKNSLEEIWNGEGYMSWRRALISGIPPECNDCPIKVEHPLIDEFKRRVFANNYLLNKREFEEGQIYLDSYPTFYSITVSTSCNLNCSFCSQNKYRKEEVAPLSEDIISNLEDYYKFAHILSWCGGETLIQKPFLDFLEEDNPRKYPDMCLKVTTNGTLLNTALYEKLNKFKTTFVVFSIDGGTKEVYEKLRIGANWETVISNLKLSRNYLNIKPTVQYTVMKSNILDVLNAVVLFDSLEVDVVFCPVVGEDLVEENIFYYPDLLKETKWEVIIDSALAYYSNSALKKSLEAIKKKLIKESILWGGAK